MTALIEFCWTIKNAQGSAETVISLEQHANLPIATNQAEDFLSFYHEIWTEGIEENISYCRPLLLNFDWFP